MSKWAFFALGRARANSFLKMAWQAVKLGCTFLKMKSFRVIQMLQHPRIITTMKKGWLIWVLNDINTSVQSAKTGTMSPMEFQNWVAMGQSRKRRIIVSSECCVQRTHSKLWSAIPLCLSRSRVLSLSFKSSQTKTLCLCWQQFFQSH